MDRLDEREAEIDDELQKLAQTLDEYERTLSEVDGTLTEGTLDDGASGRYTAGAD
jgi:prefoldin subunit 5